MGTSYVRMGPSMVGCTAAPHAGDCAHTLQLHCRPHAPRRVHAGAPGCSATDTCDAGPIAWRLAGAVEADSMRKIVPSSA